MTIALKFAVVLGNFYRARTYPLREHYNTFNQDQRTMATKLHHGDKSIDLSALLKSLKAFPQIDLSKNDLQKVEFARLSGAAENANNEIVVFKHEGKYIVFSGRQQVLDFVKAPGVKIKVRLMSKHALKHLETISTPLQEQNRNATVIERQIEDSQRQQYYDDRPAFRPRQEGLGNTPRLFQPRPAPRS